jgi:hypothetical protein
MVPFAQVTKIVVFFSSFLKEGGHCLIYSSNVVAGLEVNS